MNTIKIFESYHKDSERIASDILTPIHVGRALASEEIKKSLSDMIGDDTGDNISSKNPNYCELTAQYWAWKHCDAEYIGFMHYRRHLSFNIDEIFDENKWGVIHENEIHDSYIKKFRLDDTSIRYVVSQYDILTVKQWPVQNAGSKNNYDHYKYADKKLFIKDYDNALKILEMKYPEYKKDVIAYNKSLYGYYTNIFIMKRNLFNNYCSWLFDILFELEKITDITLYNSQEARVFGYISEWLFGIFITHYKNSNIKIKELQRTFIENTDKYTDETIHLCFASSDTYAQHLGVSIASIVENKRRNDNISIHIIDGGISERNKNKIILCAKNNIIQFHKVNNEIFKCCPIDTIKNTHLSIATYYRLIIAQLFKNIDKIIYLDSDIIVKSSLNHLYSIDLKDNYFVGVKDILFNDNTKRLHLKKYVNAGVIVINLRKWRIENIQEKFFDFILNMRKKIVYHDQDVLNYVLQDKMEYIDPKWNAQTCEYDGAYDGGWNELGKTANIVHFISDKKPWIKGTHHPFFMEYIRYLMHTPWNYLCNQYFNWNIKGFNVSKCEVSANTKVYTYINSLIFCEETLVHLPLWKKVLLSIARDGLRMTSRKIKRKLLGTNTPIPNTYTEQMFSALKGIKAEVLCLDEKLQESRSQGERLAKQMFSTLQESHSQGERLARELLEQREYFLAAQERTRHELGEKIVTLCETQRRRDSTPLVSVIIPIFNTKAYLEECLESVTGQWLRDIEIICVDDGSTDGSAGILARYAHFDPRIRVITQKNAGAGVARNRGLDVARGKYIAFWDSDDVYDPSTLFTMTTKAETTDADTVVCRSRGINRDNTLFEMPWAVNTEQLTKRSLMCVDDFARYPFQAFIGWAWDKLYRREFVQRENLRFQNTRSSNDALFGFLSVILPERLAIVQDVLITHRWHSGSLEATRDKDPLCFIKAMQAIREELEKRGIYAKVEQSFVNWVATFSKWHMETVSEESSKKILSKLTSEGWIEMIASHEKEYFYDDIVEYYNMLSQ